MLDQFAETDTFKLAPKEIPLGNGNCAPRAFTIATGRTYEEVFADLAALNEGKSPNDVTLCRASDQFAWSHGLRKFNAQRKMSLNTFVREHAHKFEGRALVVRVKNHLTCVKDGKIIDQWNCGRRMVVSVFAYDFTGVSDGAFWL